MVLEPAKIMEVFWYLLGMKNMVTVIVLLICTNVAVAQKVWTPEATDVRGRGWNSGLKEKFDRMPASAEAKVRKEVWNLSRQSAGLHLNFRSNAGVITVRYTVSGQVQMPHMPATGVSGVDMYVKNQSGNWNWAAGKYRFGDTISFTFGGFTINEERTHVLYLPLYNQVNWLEVRYPEQASFSVIPPAEKKPVVIYGTSIAQGACASRPGLAWTNIVSRLIDRPVVNLAFSGNGRLEPEVYAYVGEIDASVFVLDCLPNMSGEAYIKNGSLRRRLDSTYEYLRSKWPSTPILFTEHGGYTDDGTNEARKKTYQTANLVLRSFYDSLQKAGGREIHYLRKEEIGLGIESAVDGTHPNDIGMMEYAKAYARRLRALISKNTKL